MPVRMLILLAGLFLLGGVHVAVAQVDRDSVEQRALRDFHGSDLEGKDGPLSRADLPLLRLYHQNRMRMMGGATTALDPPMPGMQVGDSTVVVDAVASGNPDRLVDDFRMLGATNVASAGRVVSGRIPVSAIAEAAQLSSLQSLRASIAQTNAPGGETVRPPPRVSADTDTTVQPSTSASDGSGLSMSFIIGAIAFVFVGGAAFAVYMQRRGMRR